MKVILVFLLLCFSVTAFCQTNPDHTSAQPAIEDLKREVLQLKQATQEIQLHLNRSHKEFRTGTIFYAIGLGLTVLTASSENPNEGLILIGTGFLLAGGVLHIDSHKHIGRAGSIRRQFRQRN